MSQPHPYPLPRDPHFDEAVVTLASRGDSVGVVRVVEAWLAQGTPTPRARLAQARAFFHLRLMDRALHRVREVLDAEPDQPDALLLLAQVYLERGWPVKARKPLQTLRDAGRTDLDAFWLRAHEDPVRPDVSAREVGREGDPTRMLALAEGFLATGSFLRATGILERLRRTEPDNARVRELLWSLAGDFGGGPSVEALISALVPRPTPPVRPTVGAAEPPEEPEHTESAGRRPAEVEAVGFPALFKQSAPPARLGADDAHEATHAFGLASNAQMAEPTAEGTDPMLGSLESLNPAAGSGDTQIMLVLRPNNTRPSNVHKPRTEGGENLRDNLNLRAWQHSMGVSGASDLTEQPQDDLLEEEDEHVVVMAREEAVPPPRDARPDAGPPVPIEVVEKHASPATPPRPSPPVAAEPPPTAAPTEPAPSARGVSASGQPPSGTPRFVWVFAALVAGMGLLIGALVLGNLSLGGDGNTVRADLVRALAKEDYNALLTQEGRLGQRIAGGQFPDEAADLRGALAEARLAVWSEYNGDPTRLDMARDALAAPAGFDLHRIAVLRATEALVRQDIRSASSALGRERPEDDEERLLFARIAARSGDLARAEEHFAAIRQPNEPRYKLAHAQALAAAGRDDEARALARQVLATSPAHASAEVLLLELTYAPPLGTIAAADRFLRSQTSATLAPRLEGRVQVVRARAFAALHLPAKAREAAESGLARDGANPDLLFLRAADLGADQRLTEALHQLENVVDARPGDGSAQAAYLLILLDLDRVEEADALVGALESKDILPDLTPVLRVLVSVWGKQERPPVTLLPPQAETPLGAYATALLTVQERAPDALQALDAAVPLLLGSADPFERRLAARLLAMKALVSGAPDGDAYAKAALAADAADPAVHVFLGRYYESSGRKALAALHFERAPQLGPELGLSWYDKGRFYLDARDSFARSGAAWRNFLALAPSGIRARRAKDTLGVR